MLGVKTGEQVAEGSASTSSLMNDQSFNGVQPHVIADPMNSLSSNSVNTIPSAGSHLKNGSPCNEENPLIISREDSSSDIESDHGATSQLPNTNAFSTAMHPQSRGRSLSSSQVPKDEKLEPFRAQSGSYAKKPATSVIPSELTRATQGSPFLVSGSYSSPRSSQIDSSRKESDSLRESLMLSNENIRKMPTLRDKIENFKIKNSKNEPATSAWLKVLTDMETEKGDTAKQLTREIDILFTYISGIPSHGDYEVPSLFVFEDKCKKIPGIEKFSDALRNAISATECALAQDSTNENIFFDNLHAEINLTFSKEQCGTENNEECLQAWHDLVARLQEEKSEVCYEIGNQALALFEHLKCRKGAKNFDLAVLQEFENKCNELAGAKSLARWVGVAVITTVFLIMGASLTWAFFGGVLGTIPAILMLSNYLSAGLVTKGSMLLAAKLLVPAPLFAVVGKSVGMYGLFAKRPIFEAAEEASRLTRQVIATSMDDESMPDKESDEMSPYSMASAC